MPPSPLSLRTLALWTVAGVLACGPAFDSGRRAACAGEPRAGRPESAESRLNALRRRAIRRGCAWIAAGENQEGWYGHDAKAAVAFTALSTLALMADGSGMGRGPYGKEVEKAVRWLTDRVLKPQPTTPPLPEGYFHFDNDLNSKMHGQGYATLALASALGTAKDKNADEIRRALKLAVGCCQDSQAATGGWGYEPARAVDHEGSVTVTIAHALRAARDAGVLVSENVVRHGLDYLRNSQKLSGSGPASASPEDDGSFKYSLNTESSSYALTAAAISSFFLFGDYGRDKASVDRIDRGIAYMKRKLGSTLRGDDRFFHYGHFYAAWSAWQKDGDQPEPLPGESWGDDPTSRDIEHTKQFWGPWHAKIYRVLIEDQSDDGSWSPRSDPYGFGSLVPTTFAVLTLAIPDELLPIFQR